MLMIKPTMGGTMEEVLTFKTACCWRLMDQNLEIIVANTSDEEIEIAGYFDLEGENLRSRVAQIIPSGKQKIARGEAKAFYCWMDETLWGAARAIVFFDTRGRRFERVIEHGA